MRVSTTPIAVPRAFAVAPVALFLLVAATGSGPATAQPGSLAGVYDGGQMEIAAALELKPNGRFNYALSYGALDEQAAGRWTVNGDRVLLSSNPVVAPRLFLISRGRGPEGMLQLSLDVPRGVSRQYFDAMIHTRQWADAKGAAKRRGPLPALCQNRSPERGPAGIADLQGGERTGEARSEFRLRRPV